LFGSAEVSRTVIDHYRNKLNSLKLTQTSEANDYINDYILCSLKLETKHKGYTAEAKLTKFLDGIEDDDYDVAVQSLRSDKTKTFQDTVLRIRTREQELLKSQRDATSKARRATSSGSGTKSTSANKSSTVSEKQIPSIPNWILRSIKPDNVRRDIIRWRGVWNLEEGHLQASEKTAAGDNSKSTTRKKTGSSNKRKQSDVNSVGSGNNRHSEKSKRQKTKQSGRTKTSKIRLSSTPQVYLKDEDDEDNDTSGSEYDSDSKPQTTKSSKKNLERLLS
jgi:hypothetical protein